MFGLSPFAGEIPRHSATCRVHCQAIPNLFLVIVQKAWEEKIMKLCTFNCFFFYSLGKDQVWKYHPLCYSQDPTDGRRQVVPSTIGACSCDRYDRDIPVGVIKLKLHRLLTSVC
mgnify:FL=1|jgi:hypothetical protein